MNFLVLFFLRLQGRNVCGWGICLYFAGYCKYDIFEGWVSKYVEISRLHKFFFEMWIGEFVWEKFSTF